MLQKIRLYYGVKIQDGGQRRKKSTENCNFVKQSRAIVVLPQTNCNSFDLFYFMYYWFPFTTKKVPEILSGGLKLSWIKGQGQPIRDENSKVGQ